MLRTSKAFSATFLTFRRALITCGFLTLAMEPQTQSVTVKKNQTVNLKIFLSTKSVELQDIEISAEKQQRKTETRVSVTSVGQIELKRMPTVGGEPDIAQYLQVLPGVVSTGDPKADKWLSAGNAYSNSLFVR